MRATGLPREQADPMMARLMLDYEGDVGVSEDGGIFYSFPAMRKTAASESETSRPSAPLPAAWDDQPKPLPPLTGNSAGANVGIAALNAFNLLMGFWAIGNGLTLERVSHLFDRIPPPMVDSGVPIALGIVPIVFSALLFVVPVGRALVRPSRQRKQVEERGRLAVLRAVLERVRGKQPVTDRVVAEAWRGATGRPAEASAWTGSSSRSAGTWTSRRAAAPRPGGGSRTSRPRPRRWRPSATRRPRKRPASARSCTPPTSADPGNPSLSGLFYREP